MSNKAKEGSPQADNLAYRPSRLLDNLKLSRRRSHVVIALLPLLEAQGAVEDLDVEDSRLALQLEVDDEGRDRKSVV